MRVNKPRNRLRLPSLGGVGLAGFGLASLVGRGEHIGLVSGRLEFVMENMEATADKRTPLFDSHRALQAKFVPFGGWEMPVQYSGVIDEHHTVRNAAGLFDVSHMGEVLVEGLKALEYLQAITSNDVAKLEPGRAQYSLLLNHDGGVVDDIIVYRRTDDGVGPSATPRYLVCVNAANADKDFAWMLEQNTFGTSLTNASEDYGQIAIQGPKAWEIMSLLKTGQPVEFSSAGFPTFSFQEIDVVIGQETFVKVIIARTGYTGEDGFEIFTPAEQTPLVWNELLRLGAPLGLKPCGLGARDTLRLEACYPLHGHELSDSLPALQCGVGWVIKFAKPEFIGRNALLTAKEAGLPQALVGFAVEGRGIVRDGAKIFDASGKNVGWASSGTMTPTIGKAIGMAFVDATCAQPDTQLEAEVRDKRLPIILVKMPFYRKPKAV